MSTLGILFYTPASGWGSGLVAASTLLGGALALPARLDRGRRNAGRCAATTGQLVAQKQKSPPTAVPGAGLEGRAFDATG